MKRRSHEKEIDCRCYHSCAGGPGMRGALWRRGKTYRHGSDGRTSCDYPGDPTSRHCSASIHRQYRRPIGQRPFP